MILQLARRCVLWPGTARRARAAYQRCRAEAEMALLAPVLPLTYAEYVQAQTYRAHDRDAMRRSASVRPECEGARAPTTSLEGMWECGGRALRLHSREWDPTLSRVRANLAP